jgi:hypothetical protein
LHPLPQPVLPQLPQELQLLPQLLVPQALVPEQHASTQRTQRMSIQLLLPNIEKFPPLLFNPEYEKLIQSVPEMGGFF